MTTHVAASAGTGFSGGGRPASAGPGADLPIGLTGAGEPLWGHLPGSGPAGFSACGLDGGLRNASQARRFTAHTLEGWGLVRLVPDAALIVSELVTNAVRHALDPDAPDSGEYPVWLGFFLRPGLVVCAVTDPSCTPPRPRGADACALGGRGLALVAAVSESWSWTLTPPRGKTVWAALAR
ncbi:ATP-binding protein [Streptomyces yaizuensis]|uniref:ATP-binding protein n=1 Tax=Streptomyces yaizuensis TaxID=2989713 RepID=A0ABQ5P354_9ACTN|nr:ATP-binding protein [Streptomyces sp. YSPA8]GLF96920.1 ATP-binding protein [Streptomyces sp. YSPA8]